LRRCIPCAPIHSVLILENRHENSNAVVIYSPANDRRSERAIGIIIRLGATAGANKNAPAAAASSIPAPPAITAETSPADLAKAAVAALGGEKFRHVQNIWLVGSVDLYAPNTTVPQPGKFSIVTAGGKVSHGR
jgi:hypothetical protein